MLSLLATRPADRHLCRALLLFSSFVTIVLLIGFLPMVRKQAQEPFEIPLDVCEAVCGSGVALSSDWAERIMSWVWPVVFLTSSIAISPFGLETNFLMATHALANPIDTFYSIFRTISYWERIEQETSIHANQLGQQSLISIGEGTAEQFKHCLILILHAMDTLSAIIPENYPRRPFSDFIRQVTQQEPRLVFSVGNALRCHRRRSSGYGPVVVAAISLFFALTGLGGSGVSGGKIAAGFIFTWLLPLTLLRCQIGDWHNLHGIHLQLQRLVLEVGKKNKPWVDVEDTTFLDPPDLDVAVLAQNGILPTFQHSGDRPGERRIYCLLLSFCPVLLSFCTAFGALLAPQTTSFTDRHWLVIGIAGLLIGNTCASGIFLASQRARKGASRGPSSATLYGDCTIAAVILGVLVSSATGLLNSCRTWSN
ncbi:uncharacterized protein B0T15DRAFT_509865 [Chaetomium strumarium]|uniref:Uncharacterized protein n=1 Tax=Chaetomium strumarium TaxID=1170767 RepID=A0AAJ0GUN4_9PEZI|nr:hypothetical protein B0T15DRAFT_509865 [Chaetomium strumarium]